MFGQLPQPWIVDQPGIAPPSGSHTLSANKVYLWAFEVLVPLTITAMRWEMAATATGTADVGIYDANGNLLGHTGATANVASTNNSAPLINIITLTPGRYYLALCPSNSSDTYFAVNGVQDNTTPATTRIKFAATNGTAGVLPATTGGTALSGNIPVISAVVSGGIA